MSKITIDSVVAGYVRLRAKRATVKQKAEAEMATLDAQMEKLEAWIKLQADALGVTSFKTQHGTAFLTTTDYANVADWDAILKFIKENNAYDMLEKRISKNAVRGYIDANKSVPPGVNYGTRLDVNVRKPAQKLDE